jgi:lipopolysaccharide transport system ATP-binding protein
MSDIVLSVENLWKQYRLGVVGASSLREDVGRWVAKLRGKEDPRTKIGETNDRENIKGEYVWALQDINFEVKKGEVLGIIGKNGAGKSTLLKILSKVTTPTKGIIRTKGRIASLLEVGTGFHPELTGRENIFLNGAILGMTKNDIRKKFDEIVEFSGVGKYIDTPVKRYSSGMYVRLAFAVAAHLEPEILIIDEVLAVGDAEFQKKCLGKMKDVSGEGRTVLFVSHNMGAISLLCSSILMLKKGTVEFCGNTSTGIKKYLTDGLNVMNNVEFFNNSKYRRGNGKVRFSSILITDEEGLLKQEFEKGEKIKFTLTYRSHLESINATGVSICFRTAHTGDFVSSVEEKSKLSKGEQECVFVIDSQNMRAGIYDLYFHIGSEEEAFDVIDSLTNPLIIVEKEKSHKIFDKYNGYFDLKYTFLEKLK